MQSPPMGCKGHGDLQGSPTEQAWCPRHLGSKYASHILSCLEVKNTLDQSSMTELEGKWWLSARRRLMQGLVSPGMLEKPHLIHSSGEGLIRSHLTPSTAESNTAFSIACSCNTL